MSLLDKIKFTASEAFGKVFMFTGTVENPTEKYDISDNFYQWIIILFFRRPGLIVAPDGSEFMVELTLTPAAKAAKEQMLADAQARLDAQRQIGGDEPAEGTKEWLDTLWARQLTDADRLFFERISQLRASGHRVNYRTTNPTQFSVSIVEPPKPARNKKAVTVGQPTEAPAVAVEPGQERIPVVVLTVPEAISIYFIVERSHFDSYAPAGSDNWLEKSIQAFADDNGLSRDDITSVDFDQTRTRAELDKLPDFVF